MSGGHTLLVAVQGLGRYEVLGQSLDDAAGEAFDKVAKLLGLPYPGGPAIAQLAQQGEVDRFYFTRPMVNRPGLDFSFSGLKTAVMNEWRRWPPEKQNTALKASIALAFERALVDTLIIKCQRALKTNGPESACGCWRGWGQSAFKAKLMRIIE